MKSKIQKAMTHSNKLGAGASKRRASNLSKPEKVEVVMKEYKRGTLHSGSGSIVSNPKQAIAIALSEAKKTKRKK